MDLYQNSLTTRFMLAGPSRVQGRIYQRQLPLKAPGAWPGVHINGKCVGHFLPFWGWTIELFTLSTIHFPAFPLWANADRRVVRPRVAGE